MRSANQPTFVRHIDGAAYGDGQQHIMDEDHALEQAEAEIRRLKDRLSVAKSLVDAALNGHKFILDRWRTEARAFLSHDH